MSQLQLLLVEDHAPTVAIMAILLEREGFEVSTADSVSEALSLASSRKFDVLVSDLGLPDGTGIDLLRQIRKLGGSYPAIAMTGHCDQEDIAATEAAGFAIHLSKPVDVPDLCEAIDKVVSR
jgi:CheY-like chemotaxis protein